MFWKEKLSEEKTAKGGGGGWGEVIGISRYLQKIENVKAMSGNHGTASRDNSKQTPRILIITETTVRLNRRLSLQSHSCK